jgi:hypothetical protein
MSTNVKLTLTHSLAHDSRTNLEVWLEEAETVSRNLALSSARPYRRPYPASLPQTKSGQHEMPVNVTIPVDVLNGQPPVCRARPTWDMPAQHARNAAAAVVSIYKKELASALHAHGVYPG